MAVVGSRQNQAMQNVLQSYERNELHDLAEAFTGISRAGLTEHVDLFDEPRKFFMKSNLNNQMKIAHRYRFLRCLHLPRLPQRADPVIS